MLLTEFNTLPEEVAADAVAVWAAVPSWVTTVVAGRPYPSVDALADAAAAAAAEWSEADLDAALAHHPRIGERPRGDGAEAQASRSEQAAMGTATDDTAAAIAAGNVAYERRFGRVYLIRAAGRSPEELLSELTRRLDNDDVSESVEARGQLAEIALLRLRGAVTPDDAAAAADPAEKTS